MENPAASMSLIVDLYLCTVKSIFDKEFKNINEEKKDIQFFYENLTKDEKDYIDSKGYSMFDLAELEYCFFVINEAVTP